jgi:hydrogenase maturation protease
MPHTLIIGYGNPLRGDDGIGPRAAELLSETLSQDETPEGVLSGVEVLVCQQLTLELAPEIAEVDRLILIDAAANGEPGRVERRALAPAISQSASLTHHVDAQALLAAAQILYGHVPEAALFTVSANSFDHGATLSPAVAAALPGLLAQLREAVLS